LQKKGRKGAGEKAEGGPEEMTQSRNLFPRKVGLGQTSTGGVRIKGFPNLKNVYPVGPGSRPYSLSRKLSFMREEERARQVGSHRKGIRGNLPRGQAGISRISLITGLEKVEGGLIGR